MKARVYTEAQMQRAVEMGLERARRQARSEVLDLAVSLALWGMWDTFPKVSKKRMGKALEFMMEKAALIVDGTISLDDIKQMLNDEAGIVFGYKGEN